MLEASALGWDIDTITDLVHVELPAFSSLLRYLTCVRKKVEWSRENVEFERSTEIEEGEVEKKIHRERHVLSLH